MAPDSSTNKGHKTQEAKDPTVGQVVKSAVDMGLDVAASIFPHRPLGEGVWNAAPCRIGGGRDQQDDKAAPQASRPDNAAESARNLHDKEAFSTGRIAGTAVPSDGVESGYSMGEAGSPIVASLEERQLRTALDNSLAPSRAVVPRAMLDEAVDATLADIQEQERACTALLVKKGVATALDAAAAVGSGAEVVQTLSESVPRGVAGGRGQQGVQVARQASHDVVAELATMLTQKVEAYNAIRAIVNAVRPVINDLKSKNEAVCQEVAELLDDLQAVTVPDAGKLAVALQSAKDLLA